ncbi:MAG: bifunctional phosphopantothenoylcysteine decarboxylase/phosphopantothenate--cysteine ligase CoaBC [Balneolales bacterium]
MLSGKRIILGVTGGIAAYKSVFLLRELQKAGADVRVTLTPSATHFVGLDTFSAISRHEVPVSVFPEDSFRASENWVRHIQWSEWADLFIIAPCTANTLAKIVNGFSDSMLTAIALSVRCPVLICPTMDGGMYQAPVTQQNLEKAVILGYHILDPESGYLASGINDVGRLPETHKILAKVEELLLPNLSNDLPLSGRKVLVTAGPTREFIDPVRFLSNPSSGKMGYAMAKAAKELGAEVTLLQGPVSLPELPGVTIKKFVSTDDLFNLVKDHKDADVIVMAAAVSDFRPRRFHSQKVKKDQADETFDLDITPDILEWLGKHKKTGQILIGFAMETEKIRENALLKFKKKKLDWIVANSIDEMESAFMSDQNTVLLISEVHEYQISGSKMDVALKVMHTIFKKSTSV